MKPVSAHDTAGTPPVARRRAPTGLASARRGRRGAQMLEFVLILPFFLLLMVAAIDMGRLVLTQTALHDAAYTASRTGAQLGGANVGGNNIAANVFYETVAATPGLELSRTTLTYTGPALCQAFSSARFVRVDATYNFQFLTPGLYSLLNVSAGGNWTVRATGVSRCEVVR